MHKYGKFTDQEITELNDKNDLVAKVQPKYRLDRPRRKALSMRSRKGGSELCVSVKWSPSAIVGGDRRT